MDELPIELWTRITEETDTWTLLSLSTTCHVLSTIAQTTLYRRVKLRDNASFSLSTLFARSLSERPGLAGYVRSLKIRLSYNGHYPMTTFPAGKNPVLTQLSSFVNVKMLKLTGFHLDAGIHAAIHALPSLGSLILQSCTTDRTSFDTASQANSRGVISDLSLFIYPTYATDVWTAYLHPGLRSLTLGGFAYGEEDTFSPEAGVFNAMKHINITSSLTKLVWCDDAITPQLIQFLNLSLEIRSVYLRAPYVSDETYGNLEYVTQLSSTAIPKLEKFFGPAAYAEIFVRNRPVVNITINLERTTRVNVLDSLRYSSATVRDLELHIIDDGKQIEHFLPHVPTTLHSLAFHDSDVREDNVAAWIDALSRMPSLRRFEIGVCLESFRGYFVQAFSDACPSLVEIAYGGDEPWYKRQDGSWERFFRYNDYGF